MAPEVVKRHWRRTWRVTVGLVLCVVGVALLFLPGPGLLVIIAGLAVMSDEVPIAHRLMERLKKRLHQAEERIKRAVD